MNLKFVPLHVSGGYQLEGFIPLLPPHLKFLLLHFQNKEQMKSTELFTNPWTLLDSRPSPMKDIHSIEFECIWAFLLDRKTCPLHTIDIVIPTGKNNLCAQQLHHAMVTFVIVLKVRSATDVYNSSLQVLALYCKGSCQNRGGHLVCKLVENLNVTYSNTYIIFTWIQDRKPFR